MAARSAWGSISRNVRGLAGIATLLIGLGILFLLTLLVANARSDWIAKNGGLASWIQALGSIYAIVAVSYPVMLERRFARDRARKTVLSSAAMAHGLMITVAENAYDPEARFSEWWVPQWQVIEEVLASAPIHDIASPVALEAFVTLRELYGRARGWEESEGGQPQDDSMQSYVYVLCSNAGMAMGRLRDELS